MNEVILQIRKEMCYKCSICDTCIEMDDYCLEFAKKVVDKLMEE